MNPVLLSIQPNAEKKISEEKKLPFSAGSGWIIRRMSAWAGAVYNNTARQSSTVPHEADLTAQNQRAEA